MVTVKDLMVHFGGGEGEADGPHLSRAQATRLIRQLPGAEKVPGPPGRLAKWQAPMTIEEVMDYFEEHPEIFEDAVRERPRTAAVDDDLKRDGREIGGLDNELRAVKKEELEAQRMEARTKRLEAEEKVERIERRRDGDKDRGELAAIFQGQAEALRTLIEKQSIGLKDLLAMLNNNRGADPVEQISRLLELQRKMQPEAPTSARDNLDDIRRIGELVRTLRDLGLVGEGGVSAEPAFSALLLETFNRYAQYVGPQVATLLRGVALWMTRQQGSAPHATPSMPVATTPGPELSAEEHSPEAQTQAGTEPAAKTIPTQLIPGVILQDVINRILPALQSESPDYERVWRVVSDYVPPYILDDLMGRMDHEVLGLLASVDPRLADPTLQPKLIRLLEQGRQYEEESEIEPE